MQKNLTRWNSTFDCLSSIKKAGLKINTLLRKLELQALSCNQMTFIQEYIILFGPLAKGLDQLQSNQASIGYIRPVVSVILKKIREAQMTILNGLQSHLVERIGEN